MALEYFLISGRVQGVGYRAWCKSYAERLGLSGWVRNLADKRVELLVFDQDADSLALLKSALSKGPVFASVKSVECQHLEQGSTTEELLTSSAGFAILRTSITALQHSLKSQETQ